MSNRALTLLIAAVVVVTLGILFYRQYFMVDPDAEMVSPPDATADESRKPRIRVVMTRCARVFGRTELEGYVENTGTVDLRFVTVQSIWKNVDGLIIETDVVYVVNDETLKPGERKAFRDVSRMSNAEKCNARPLDWWS